MIVLKCSNEYCNYCYKVTPKELENNPQYHSNCLICGSLLKVDNLKEIITKNLYERAEEYINKWVSELGWDRTLDLIAKNKEQACYRIYKEILEKRGFKIK